MLHKLLRRRSALATSRLPVSARPAMLDQLEPRMLFSADWSALGPGGGGSIQDLELDPGTPGVMYSLSDVDGLYKSTNFGDTWTKELSEDIHTGSLLDLEVDPFDPDHLLLGTMRGVLESTDGGVTWNDVAGTTSQPGGNSGQALGLPVGTITFDESEQGTAYFASSWRVKNTLSVWGDFGFNLTSTSPDMYKPGVIYRKTNGNDWEQLTFDPNTANEYMHVYSIKINPADNKQIFVSASTGNFRYNANNNTWTELPMAFINGQSGQRTFSAHGLDISPDGKQLYAAFATADGDYIDKQEQNASPTKLYVARNLNNASATKWVESSANLIVATDSPGTTKEATGYWNPTVDRDDDGVDHVLLGSLYGTPGLWQASFDTNGLTANKNNTTANPITADWQQILWTEGAALDDPSKTFTYEPGFDVAFVVSRVYDFAPDGWGGDNVGDIWTASGQRVFQGNPDASDGAFPYSPNSWIERYSEKTSEFRTNPNSQNSVATFYQSRGIQSTVNWESDALGSYVIQAMADNGILESYDGGITWTEGRTPAGVNARAVEIFENTRLTPGGPITPLVVAATGSGGLGGNADMSLSIKAIDNGPTDIWERKASIGRGLNGTTGGERRFIHDITAANNGRSAFIGTLTNNKPLDNTPGQDNFGEIYFIDDIATLYNDGRADRLGNPNNNFSDGDENSTSDDIFTLINDNTYVRRLEVDPNNNNRFYVMGGEGGIVDDPINTGVFRNNIYRFDKVNGNWNKTEIASGSGPARINDLAVWDNNGTTMVAYTDTKFVNNETAGADLYLSDNAGNNFNVVYSIGEVEENTTSYTGRINSFKGMNITGLAGDGDKIYFSQGLSKHRKGLGTFRATVSGSGNSLALPANQIRSITGTGTTLHGDTRVNRSVIATINGQKTLMHNTSGAGLWTYDLSQNGNYDGSFTGGLTGNLDVRNGIDPGDPGDPGSGTDTVRTDGFENGLTGGSGWGNNNDWVVTDNVDVITSAGPTEGSQHARLRRNGGIERSIDLSGADSGTLSFDWKANSLESGEFGVAEIKEGNTWTELARIEDGQDNNTYTSVNVTLNNQIDFEAATDLRFRIDGSGNGDYVYLDNVTLTTTESGGGGDPGSGVGGDSTPDFRYRFNGNYSNSAGSGDGNAIGGVGFVGDSQEGSQSADFDGNGDAVRVNNGNLRSSVDSFTVAFWFKADSLGGQRTLVDLGNADAGLTVRLNGGSLQVRLAHGDANNKVTTVFLSNAISTGQWNQVVVTFDGTGDLKLNLNNTQSHSNSSKASSMAALSEGLSLGGRQGTDAFNQTTGDFDGQIDDFRYWQNYVLTTAEIDDLF